MGVDRAFVMKQARGIRAGGPQGELLVHTCTSHALTLEPWTVQASLLADAVLHHCLPFQAILLTDGVLNPGLLLCKLRRSVRTTSSVVPSPASRRR